jgi:hypothetical protein
LTVRANDGVASAAAPPPRWAIESWRVWLILSLKDRYGEIADWVEAAVRPRAVENP